MRLSALSFALLLTPLGALADRALLVGVPADDDLARAVEGAGFDTVTAPTTRATEMRAALSGLLGSASPGERRLIYLSGSFVSDGRSSWLLQGRDTGQPDRATIDDVALALDAVLAVAGRAPGQALVVLAIAEDADTDPGAGLTPGLMPPHDVPQGVTILHGPQRDIARLLAGPVLEPGRDLSDVATDDEDVAAGGYLPVGWSLLPPASPEPDAPDEQAAEAPEPQSAQDLWTEVQAQDTAQAYLRYLDRFPEGANADTARARLATLRAQAAEDALDLDREARRRVQSHLTLLGYQPRGIDGIFGPGSRGAIERFQEQAGYPVTGFLTREQLDDLQVRAAQRQAELEAEAERAREQAEREDRAVWQATGAAGDAAGLRTYLQRYPEGLFAEEARRQLDRIEAEKRAAAEAADAAAWERARESDTADAYRDYLSSRPEGAFAAEARARIDAITRESEGAAAREAAQAAEAQLGLNDVTRLLAERRMQQLGLDPGRVDGTFDESTRAAIRRFQRDRGIEPTGYLTQDTVARMISGFGGQILRELQ